MLKFFLLYRQLIERIYLYYYEKQLTLVFQEYLKPFS